MPNGYLVAAPTPEALTPLTRSELFDQLGKSWRGLVAILAIFGFLAAGWGKVKTVAQIPEKVDSLKMAHDSQTTILREQLKLQRCLVILALDPRNGRQRCLSLTLTPGDP